MGRRKVLEDENIKNIIERISKCKYKYSKIINKRIYVYLTCSCNNDFNCRLDQFYKKKQCNICSKKERQISIDELKVEFQKRNYKLLSTEYINNHEPLDYICLKHEYKGVQNSTWQSIKKGSGCYFCGLEKSKLTRSYTYDFVKNKIKNYNLELLISPEEYINTEQKLKVINDDGYLLLINFKNLKRFKPSIFGNGNPFTIHNIKLWLLKNSINLFLKSTEFTKATDKMIWTCEKHGDFKMSWICIQSGTRCPICSQSKGEEKIRIYLNKNNINYNQQYKINNCKNKKPLSFDFAIFEDKEKIKLLFLCEYDGELHYNPPRYSKDKEKMLEKLKNIIKKDNIKNEYCKNNNIPLLRIPYWDFDRIEEILDKELSL